MTASRRAGIRAPVAGGRARILIAGDLFAGRRPEAALATGDPSAVWGALGHVFEAHHLCIAGLEAPLTHKYDTIEKWGPHLRAAPKYAAAISRTFQMVNLANNHIMDMGAGGLRDTIEACRAAGLHTVGAGEDIGHAATPASVALDGVELVIIAAADREFSIAGPQSPGAAPIDPGELIGAVGRHSGKGRQVVVLLHAGNEHYPLPSPALQRLCRQVVEAGAACVVCSHSHIPGGMERWEGRPIVYGTGNFLFDTLVPRGLGWHIGQLVSLELDPRGSWGLELISYEQCLEGPVVRPLSGELLEQYQRRSSCLDGTIADPEAVEAAWCAFVARNRRRYLSTLLGLTRAERALLRLGVWPAWRMAHKDLAAVRDLFTCEAHREVVSQVLEAETNRVSPGSPGASAALV